MRFLILLFGIEIVLGGLPQIFEEASVKDTVKSVSSYLLTGVTCQPVFMKVI